MKILAVLAVAATTLSPAFAQDQCPKLTLVTSVEMHIGNDGRLYVPVTIGGLQKSMLVDTGGFFTEVKPSVADELKIAPYQVQLELVGTGGQTTDRAIRTSFKIGSLSTNAMDYMISDGDFASDVPDAAGVLAPNLLHDYDADFDFGGKKFNLISQNHCDGKVVYWPADTVAVVPMQVNGSRHIVIPITLDGKSLNAMLDTGASNSVLNLNTAEVEFKITPGSADTPAVDHMRGNRSAIIYSHRFKTLELAGITVANPEMTLIPDLMSNKMNNPENSIEHGTRIPDRTLETGLPQVIIGMDVLRRLHLYIAYKEEKLYVTPAAPAATISTTSATSAH